jgi:hypothetical protein
MPVLLGLGYRGQSPLDIYARIKGAADSFEPSRRMQIGSELEPLMRQWFCHDTGLGLEAWANHSIVHYVDEERRMAATPDGIIADQNAGLELKWTSDPNWERFGIQCQAHLMVAGFDRVHLYVTDGDSAEHRIIEPDPIMQAAIEQQVKAMLFLVDCDTPPDPTAWDSKTLASMFSREPAECAVQCMDASLPELIAKLKSERDSLDARVETLQNAIKLAIGDNTYCTFPGGEAVSWKWVDRKEYTVKASSSRQMRWVKKLPKSVAVLDEVVEVGSEPEPVILSEDVCDVIL